MQELYKTSTLSKAMKKELEALVALKERGYVEPVISEQLSKYLEDRKVDVKIQESVSMEVANALMSKLRGQLEPFRSVVDDSYPWEEKSASIRLSEKVQKSKRIKLWRNRKRKRIAEMRDKECEAFEQADREANEWQAREMAKDAAQLKMAKMKEIAKLKAKEEKNRLESELELVLIVEKLQELHSISIQKLKKQGHFLPEEDDKFLERVRAAVEEEERQAVAAADTEAARDAFATAEESRKAIDSRKPIAKDSDSDYGETKEAKAENIERKGSLDAVAGTVPSEESTGMQSYSEAYNSLANLPMEFYHYYHGSNNDMGTLIEVRRTWDSYIRSGGSRIPGHWIQPPPPADYIWASYLVRPK